MKLDTILIVLMVAVCAMFMYLISTEKTDTWQCDQWYGDIYYECPETNKVF